MPRDAPGPQTAAFYQYRYGLGGQLGETAGRQDQMALLQEQRAVQTHIDNLTRAPRRAAWHNESPYVPESHSMYPGGSENWEPPAETWYRRQIREARRQGVHQPSQYHGVCSID